MKKRLVQALLLSAMMVSLSAYSAAPCGANDNIMTKTSSNLKTIINKQNSVTCERNILDIVNSSNEIISDNADPIEIKINQMNQDIKDISNITNM